MRSFFTIEAIERYSSFAFKIGTIIFIMPKRSARRNDFITIFTTDRRTLTCEIGKQTAH